jgi:S-adenosylmethionine synthetase
VRGVVASIGYDNALYGFDSNTCAVISSINKQSGDIARAWTPAAPAIRA